MISSMEPQIDPRIVEIVTALAPFLEQSPSEREDRLSEDLDLATRQLQVLRLEDQGWQLLNGGERPEDGVGLDQLKEMSNLLRPAVAGSPLPKQANNLRASYTFSEPFIIPGLEQTGESSAPNAPKRGPGAPSGEEKALKALRAFMAKRTSRDLVFGKNAQELISTSCSTDGVYLLLGNDSTKVCHTIPLKDIDGVMEDPDFPGEIWAYQRTWTTLVNGKDVVEHRWYYTDSFEGKREDYLGTGPARVKVDKGSTMIDLTINNQVGWAFGVPDLWAGHVWNRNYLQAMKDGLEVTDLLAWLTAKVKKQSRAGSDSTGVVIKNGGKAGSMQTYAEGNSIDTYATSGKAYEFGALRDIAAIYALAAGVSVVDLLASPSAAGASYGSAQALAPGMRRAIFVRRERVASWMERVIQWSIGTHYQVTPASIEEETPYRAMQMVQLANMTGLFHEDEVRSRMAYLAGLTLRHPTPPEGYLVPNNANSLPRKDIDTDSSGSASTDKATKKPTKTAPSAGQGKNDGTGGTDSTTKNDIRTDGIQ